MNTDSELLEMAAKAAGIKALRDPYGFLRNCTGCDPAQNIFSAPMWSPLTDDGDAMRLAVKLRLDVSTVDIGGSEQIEVAGPFDGFFSEDVGSDPCAATRRAIVRAAAEIGRSM